MENTQRNVGVNQTNDTGANASGDQSTNQNAVVAGNDNQNTDGSTNNESTNSKGFPENTAVADMDAAEQAAYWKYQSRKHEDAAKLTRAEVEKLKQAQMTDGEKAIAEARNQGAAEARSKMAESNVNVFITARVSDKNVADVIKKSINHKAFVAEDGSIDDDALSTYLSAFGAASNGGNQRDPHQGAKPKQAAQTGAALGRAAAAARYNQNNNN